MTEDRSGHGGNGGLIRKSILIGKQPKTLALDGEDRFPGGVRLYFERHMACGHTLAPLLLSYKFQMNWKIPEELRRE
jgi:hypothetical protein